MRDLHLEYSPNFEGVWLPRGIIIDPRLHIIHKVLLSEVAAMQQKFDGAFFSNNHMGGILGLGERMVRKHISKMEEAGHLVTENRSSPSRRMWISSELQNAVQEKRPWAPPEPDIERPITVRGVGRRSTAEPTDPRSDHGETGNASAAPSPQKAPMHIHSNGNSDTAMPGTEVLEPEGPFRPARNSRATESTLRRQKEKTPEITFPPLRGDAAGIDDYFGDGMTYWERYCWEMMIEPDKFDDDLRRLEARGYDETKVRQWMMAQRLFLKIGKPPRSALR